jgi:nitroreductase
MLRSLYSMLPEPLRRLRHDIRTNCISLYWIVTNAVYDTVKYAKFSLSFKKRPSRVNEAALLTFYYHKIEKGLALPRPKVGFGASWIVPDFLPLLRSYTAKFGLDETVETSHKALEAYLSFHERNRAEAAGIVDAVEAYLRMAPAAREQASGGVIDIEAKLLKSRWTIDFDDFAAARHSVRVFSDKPVDPKDIERAVSTAQRAPSVCNRQAWRVYALTDSAAIRRALAFQNGHAGFGDQIPCLLLVTCDTSAMIFTYERNQVWIDGGLFSMALVYALQSRGLATCCLNLSIPWTVEKKLAACYKLSSSERPIMMIAVGHLPDRLLVANSQRKPLNSVLTWADTSDSPARAIGS